MFKPLEPPDSFHLEAAVGWLELGNHLEANEELELITPELRAHSIQATLGPGRRYDYILPNGLLYSNISSSQVFRTDLLNPVPLNLNSNDDIVASDHLPVQMVFNNPYDKPFKVLSFVRSNSTITLNWESVLGQPYRVENPSNLTVWDVLASNLVATSNTYTFSTNLPSASQYFRVYRVP